MFPALSGVMPEKTGAVVSTMMVELVLIFSPGIVVLVRQLLLALQAF